MQWDLGQPYLIAQGRDDGYCVHLDHSDRQLRRAPAATRSRAEAYDCRQDRRIWLDFENRIVNPDVNRDDWPQCTRPEAGGDDDQ